MSTVHDKDTENKGRYPEEWLMPIKQDKTTEAEQHTNTDFIHGSLLNIMSVPVAIVSQASLEKPKTLPGPQVQRVSVCSPGSFL
jgi:hypothetical protein